MNYPYTKNFFYKSLWCTVVYINPYSQQSLYHTHVYLHAWWRHYSDNGARGHEYISTLKHADSSLVFLVWSGVSMMELNQWVNIIKIIKYDSCKQILDSLYTIEVDFHCTTPNRQSIVYLFGVVQRKSTSIVYNIHCIGCICQCQCGIVYIVSIWYDWLLFLVWKFWESCYSCRIYWGRALPKQFTCSWYWKIDTALLNIYIDFIVIVLWTICLQGWCYISVLPSYCWIALSLLSFSWFVNMIYNNDMIIHICLNIGSHNRLQPDVSNQEIDSE